MLTIRSFGAQVRQVQKDFRTVPLPSLGDFASPAIESRRDINKLIPDYEVSTDDIQVRTNKILPEEALDGSRHPTEYVFEEQRAALDYYNLMGEKDLLIFNLPTYFTFDNLRELCNVKGVKVIDINIQNTIDEKSIACAKVTVHSIPQVKALQSALFNKWVDDKKIKTLNKKEAKHETFQKRTIIVQNIPNHYRADKLSSIFEDFGKVVSVEMIFEDVNVKEHMKNKGDKFSKQKEERIQHEINRAQQLVKDSIQTDQEYQQFLRSHLGQEEIERVLKNQGYSKEQNIPHEQQVNVLNSQISLSVHKMLTQLQKETADITNSKQLLLKLKKDLDSDIPSLETQASKQNASSFTKIDNEREAIVRLVNYVNRNREEVDDEILAELNEKINFNTLGSTTDPLQRLEDLSRIELADAYDNLYNILGAREELLKKRFFEQYKHFGLEERILFGRRDFNREFELVKDVKDFFNLANQPEDYVSVTEQINDVLAAKTLTPEQKLYYLVTGMSNPFIKYNFDKMHFATSTNQDLAEYRIYPVMDPTKTPTENREAQPFSPLHPTAQEEADEVVQAFRDEYDIPFDEIYHKEKALVDNVIKAYNALKDKQSRLPNPLGDRNIIEHGDVPESVLSAAGMHSDTQYERDQRRETEAALKKSLDGDSGTDGNYAYLMQHQDEIDKQYENGEISKVDYIKYKNMLDNYNKINKGYAFITFAHSDEAVIALYSAKLMVADNRLLDTMPMGNLDHKDLDMNYVINQMRNDSKLVEEYDRLRAAKEELDEFERNIDKDLPKNKRMDQFREMARDYIENAQGNTRSHLKRTPLEEEELNEKIRVLQMENPDIDFTQLFDTERNEQIRKNQHKQAFASYKAYQFLKHGVEFKTQKKQEIIEREQRKETGLKPKDAYQYPSLDKTLAQFISKDGNFGIINQMESYDKPGRKFNYSEKDFVESYFGKDGLRRLGFDQTPDKNRTSIFGYNESWKHRFPVEKYLIGPKIQSKVDRMNYISGRDPEDATVIKDLELNAITNRFNPYNSDHVQIKDKKHPKIAGRTMMGDLEQRYTNYIQKKIKISEENDFPPSFKGKDISLMTRGIYEEYFPKPPVRVPKAQVEDTKKTEKFEPIYDDEGNVKNTQNDEELYNDPLQKRANSKIIYSYDQHTRNNPDYDPTKDGKEALQNIEKIAKENQIETSDLLKDLNKFGPLYEDMGVTGQFYAKQNAGSLKSDFDIQSRTRQTKTLQNFADDSMSEREDEDIYQHYMNKMTEAKKQQQEERQNLDKQEKLALEQANKFTEMFPEVPRFEGYFKSQSEGRHPFDDKKEEFYDESTEEYKQRQDSEEYFQQLYHRELYGRLIGGSLTPRQFAVMFGATGDQKLKMQLKQDQDYRFKHNDKQHAAILLELKEKIRRQKVLSGEWTEQESNKKLHEYLTEEYEKFAEYKNPEEELRDLLEKDLEMKSLLVHQRFQEKEYYFDEGLGVSVSDHVKKLQSNFPDLEVSVRRDRDGYPVIKTVYKPKFKYNLDSFLNFDAKKEHEHLKETTEVILSSLLPFGKGSKDLNSLTKEQLQQSLQALMPYNLNNQERFDFDAQTHARLQKLVEERMEGKYRNDSEGFAQALVNFTENATYDKTRKINGSNKIAQPQIDYKQAFKTIDQEMDTFQTEIMQQIMMRVKDHLHLTKRKQSDFVKPRRSERSMFASQVKHYENSADNLEAVANQIEQEPDFDKEAYKQLRAEIKKRREAKERLLQQGFPELKAYMTF